MNHAAHNKLVSFIWSIADDCHADYQEKHEDNAAPFNRGIALDKILQDVMLARHKEELELYRLYASDSAFKTAWSQSIKTMLDGGSAAIGGA